MRTCENEVTIEGSLDCLKESSVGGTRVEYIKHTVEFLPVGRSSRSLGASELLQKVPGTRSHTFETPETLQNLL